MASWNETYIVGAMLRYQFQRGKTDVDVSASINPSFRERAQTFVPELLNMNKGIYDNLLV